MNVLYLTYDGLCDPLGQSQIAPYLQGIASGGNRITVVSFEKKKAFLKFRGSMEKNLSGSGIDWRPLTYHKNPPVLSSLYDILSGFIYIVCLSFKKKTEIVHCRNHIVVALIAFVVAILRRAAFIFDMRGFWTIERVEGGIWNLGNPVYKVLYFICLRMENYIRRRADFIVVLTEAVKKYLYSNYRLKNEITVIPCCADLELFYRRDVETRERCRREIGLSPGDFLFVYLGSLGTWYMLKEMMDFYFSVKAVDSDVKMLFLTNDTGGIAEYQSKHGVGNNGDLIIKSARREEIPEYLSACDASVFFIRPVFSKMASSPTKHGEILGCRIPLICNGNVGDVSSIVHESNTGVIVDDFTKESYVKAYRELRQKLLSVEGMRFEYAARKYYSLKGGIEKYLSVYQKIQVAYLQRE